MQIFLLLMMLGVLVHDEVRGPLGLGEPASPWLLLGLAIGMRVLLGGGHTLACRWTLGKLGRRGGAKAARRLERITALYRVAGLALYYAELSLGLLVWIRAAVIDTVLLDELLMIAPTIGLLIFGWWSYYPIDRRIREASLIGRVDAGLPVYPIWTRGQYLLAQVRHQLALILAPLLAILAWQEVVMRMPADWFGRPDYRWLAMIGGALVVFLAAPLIIRFLWDTVPLPPGELRRRLEAMCRRHRVGVRQLLVWRTFGGMINAAVMGLIAPLRYILLTDALLEMVPRPQVEAVMAHELAHVRKHHMFWLAAAAIGSLGALEITFGTLFMSLTPDPAIHPAMVRAAGPPTWLLSPHATLVATVAAAGVSWILVFGYVSRRFERQADAFAVRHLATEREDPARDAEGRILVDALSAHTMAGALQTVADLNHIPTTRRSWRHGSIRWRQQYLMSLVGRPVDELPIDRRVRHIKFAAGLAIAAIIAIQAWAG